MEWKSFRFELLVGGLLLLVAAGVFGIEAREWLRQRERSIVYEEMIRKLRVPDRNGEGYWVGDITELYRLGQISREVAEADTAPLNPLVPKPVPFHGYYVRAMESGPPASYENDVPTPLKGKKRSHDAFAICIYPAERGQGKYIWINCDILQLRRVADGSESVRQFPTSHERQASWSILD